MRISILLVLLVAVHAQNASFTPAANALTNFEIRNAMLKTSIVNTIANYTDANITVDGCSFENFTYDFDIIDAKIALWAAENTTDADLAEARAAALSAKSDSIKCSKKLRKAYKKGKVCPI